MDNSYLSELNLSEKESKILESAVKVFSEKGFSAATTKEIAQNAGIAEGTIFRYYKTKKDILRGIMIQAINIASSKVVLGAVEKIFLSSGEKDLREILKELLYDRIKLVDTFFPMARVLVTEAIFHEDVKEALYQNIIVKALEIFEKFHKKMVEKGMMRDDVDPTVLFRSILGNLAMLIAQRKLFGDKLALNDLDKEVDKVIDVLISGISPKTNIICGR